MLPEACSDAYGHCLSSAACGCRRSSDEPSCGTAERAASTAFDHAGTTPQDLIDNGIYSHIAIALHEMPHRSVSLALTAAALSKVPVVSSLVEASYVKAGTELQQPEPNVTKVRVEKV